MENDDCIRCDECGALMVYTPQGFQGCPECGRGDKVNAMFARIIILIRNATEVRDEK